MKYIISLFTVSFLILSNVVAQDDFLVKTDGTKYYLQIYDGVNNDKVVKYEEREGWQYMLWTADYFDGSDNQLFSFEATEMYPGYFSIVNHELTETHHLMSYNWFAYFTDADNRDPRSDKEMQFKFEKVTDEYYKLITIEKPTDGSLYGVNYTPGADALNVDENGQVDFGEVKSADITPDNMVNKVFKVIEFDPMTLFNSSIERSQELYDANPAATEVARYDLFYTMEKAREVRVFGTEAEMLAFQAVLDEAVANFNGIINLTEVVTEAKNFIENSTADDDTKSSFNSVVDKLEAFLNADVIDYAARDSVKNNLIAAQDLVNAIVSAQTYRATLAESDPRLGTAMDQSIDEAKVILANETSFAADYNNSISVLQKLEELLILVSDAQDRIATTEDFEEAKEVLGASIEDVLIVANTPGLETTDIDAAIVTIEDAIKVFIKALEAGDTQIELRNANFDEGSADWSWDTSEPAAVRPSAKGVDGSKSMTLWNGSDYQMKFYQSISGIPDGVYILSAMIQTNIEGSFNLFAESGTNVSEIPIGLEGGLAKRQLEITVIDGELEFGVRGAGENNGLGAGSWVVLDDFEVKWASNIPVANAKFDEGNADWSWDTSEPAAVRPSAKGVDGSKSMTLWNGSAYQMKFYQSISGISDGAYMVSAFIQTNIEGAYNLYAESGTNMSEIPVPLEGGLAKRKLEITVVGGKLEFGVKGAGENNGLDAGSWVVLDNFELSRMPDVPIVNPGFEEDFSGWIKESSVDWMPYIENKGVDGSKSVTFWQSADYYAFTKQSVAGLFHGSYEISAMTNTPGNGSFAIYGKSGGEEFAHAMASTTGLVKNKVLATVDDGTLEFGIRGAGEDNTAPAGNWIVFDNFQVLLKSIIPDYEAVVLKNEKAVEKNIGLVPENKIVYWQNDQKLNIRSNNAITDYAVYNITGSKVDQGRTNHHQLQIPMRKGIFLVKVLTVNGYMETQKVIIK